MSGCEDKYCELREEACNNRFKYLERNLTLQLDANDKAVNIAKEDMERRLEGMNEFRAQLSAQAQTFISRTYFEGEHKVLMKEIEALSKWKARCEGETSWSNIIAAVAVVISLITLIIYFLTRHI